LAPRRQCSVVCCWSDPPPLHRSQAFQVGRGLRLRAPVGYQLGRSGIVHPARCANTSVPVRSLRRSAADRECPLIIAASSPACGPQLCPTRQSTHGALQMTSSVSGNVVGCSCFRILVVSCSAWSADVHGRMPPSRAVVTQLVTRLLRLRSDHLDTNYRRARRLDDLGS
jgi:hypothetical protein